jgi:hypothetical protein
MSLVSYARRGQEETFPILRAAGGDDCNSYVNGLCKTNSVTEPIMFLAESAWLRSTSPLPVILPTKTTATRVMFAKARHGARGYTGKRLIGSRRVRGQG